MDLFNDFVELLENKICLHGTKSIVICEFCNKEYSSYESEYISFGHFAGKQYIYHCRCEEFIRYAKFLYSHGSLIVNLFLEFGKLLKIKGVELEQLSLEDINIPED